MQAHSCRSEPACPPTSRPVSLGMKALHYKGQECDVRERDKCSHLPPCKQAGAAPRCVPSLSPRITASTHSNCSISSGLSVLLWQQRRP